ncbi:MULTISPECIES: hypothetical protein [unclassified Streptomyces]
MLNVAVTMALGVIVQPIDEQQELGFLITIALQWDLSPEYAAPLLTAADD